VTGQRSEDGDQRSASGGIGRPPTRPCPVPRCPRRMPHYWLMCRPHWRTVPMLLKRAVWAAYHDGQEDDLSLVTPEYLAARRAAIEAVLEKEQQAAGSR
jgi:hypothetical protein